MGICLNNPGLKPYCTTRGGVQVGAVSTYTLPAPGVWCVEFQTSNYGTFTIQNAVTGIAERQAVTNGSYNIWMWMPGNAGDVITASIERGSIKSSFFRPFAF